MTPRTPYFEAYYQDHAEVMRKKYREAYRHRVHKGYGAELQASGLYKMWRTVNGQVEYIGELHRTKYGYRCEAGYFTTQKAALAATVEGLEDTK